MSRRELLEVVVVLAIAIVVIDIGLLAESNKPQPPAIEDKPRPDKQLNWAYNVISQIERTTMSKQAGQHPSREEPPSDICIRCWEPWTPLHLCSAGQCGGCGADLFHQHKNHAYDRATMQRYHIRCAPSIQSSMMPSNSPWRWARHE